jgi:hypothetical protein
MFLETALPAEAHLAEGQYLLDEKTTQKVLCYTVQGMEDQEFPKENDRIYNQAKLE